MSIATPEWNEVRCFRACEMACIVAHSMSEFKTETPSIIQSIDRTPYRIGTVAHLSHTTTRGNLSLVARSLVTSRNFPLHTDFQVGLIVIRVFARSWFHTNSAQGDASQKIPDPAKIIFNKYNALRLMLAQIPSDSGSDSRTRLFLKDFLN